MPLKMDLWHSRVAQILLGDPRRLGNLAISLLMIPNPYYSNFKSTVSIYCIESLVGDSVTKLALIYIGDCRQCLFGSTASLLPLPIYS